MSSPPPPASCPINNLIINSFSNLVPRKKTVSLKKMVCFLLPDSKSYLNPWDFFFALELNERRLSIFLLLYV